MAVLKKQENGRKLKNEKCFWDFKVSKKSPNSSEIEINCRAATTRINSLNSEASVWVEIDTDFEDSGFSFGWDEIEKEVDGIKYGSKIFVTKYGIADDGANKMETPQKLPPFSSGTVIRTRRQMQVEPQPLYDEFIEILNVALSDASQAGIMMQEIAHRELPPPPVTTPLRNHRKSSNQRFTPYSIQRRPSNRFANPNPPPSMFDIRNTLFSPPVTPQRPALQFFSPLTLSRSADSLTPSTTPQRPSPLLNPATVSRVFNLPDFQNLHVKPCLRIIPSNTSIVQLSRPVHCVFNELTREWIIADKDRGIVFLNKDCFVVLRSIEDFEEPCAVALLNNNHCLGVLDKNGIFTFDLHTGEKRLIFSETDCRGLAVTAAGDFVTVNHRLRYIFIIPQNGDNPAYFTYEPFSLYNNEGLPSSPSYINVSVNRLVVVDYTIGSFNLYRFNPYKRELDLMIQQNCFNGVAQCRLVGGFMDQKGRIIVSNCKERICMLFDHDGKFLQQILCDGGFPRAQYLCVNNDFQAVILETIRKPHTARLCRIVADEDVLLDIFPTSMHPHAIYVNSSSSVNSSASSFTPVSPPPSSVSPQEPVSSIQYLEPGEIEENLIECKSLISNMNLNEDVKNDIICIQID